MYQLLIEQAAELFALGLELAEQQEKLASIYDRGYDLRSFLFIDEYHRLSEMATRYMLLECAHNEYKNGAFQKQAGRHLGNRYGNRRRKAG
jgi:hypothetical protein